MIETSIPDFHMDFIDGFGAFVSAESVIVGVMSKTHAIQPENGLLFVHQLYSQTITHLSQSD